MRTVQTVAELRRAVADARAAGNSIGLVPTMGSLHEGHLSLVRRAAADCGFVVVSLFVNPSQFGPGEDYERYPRDEQRDAGLAADAGADLLFAPTTREVYPDGFATTVSVAGLTDVLCGSPGSRGASHFDGVATVVAKLLNMCAPDVAYFGQKDYQQSLVIRRVVRDLDIPVADRGVPDRAGRRRPRAQLPQRLPLPARARARPRRSTAPCARPNASPRAAPAATTSCSAARAELDAVGHRAGVPRDPCRRRPVRAGLAARRAGRARDRGPGRPRPADRQHLDRASSPQPRAGRRRLDRRTANAETHAEVEDPPGDRDRLRAALRGQRHDRLRPDGASRPAARRARARARRGQRRPLRDLRDRGRARCGRHVPERRRRTARAARRPRDRRVLRRLLGGRARASTSRKVVHVDERNAIVRVDGDPSALPFAEVAR